MSTKQYRRIRRAAAKVIEALESRVLLSSVEGFKFNDLNHNGVREADEPGLAGWAIYADLNVNGQFDVGEPAAITNASGGYRISDLPAGQYHIREVAQSGWITTVPLGGGRMYVASRDPWSDHVLISELNPKSGEVINSFLAPGDARGVGPQGLAVGPHSLFFVQGWDDTPHTLYELDLDTGAMLDADVIDAADPAAVDGIAYLDGKLYFQRYMRQQILVVDPTTDTTVATLNTDLAEGGGGMAGDPGSHTLLMTKGNGAICRVDPATGHSSGILAGAGTFIGGLAVVDGTVYAAPYNYNGLVYLFDAATGAAKGTMATGITGMNIGALGGDGIANGAEEYVVTLATNEQRWGLDFGAYQGTSIPGTISGTQFNDLDHDGVRDAGEPALAGWTVYADVDADGQLDAGEPSAVTGADGRYSLSNLAAGSYHIRAVPQAGWTLTAPTGSGRLYAAWADAANQQVTIGELDPQTGAILNSFTAPGVPLSPGLPPQGLAVGPQSLFFVNGGTVDAATLYELDLNTGAIIDSDVLGTINGVDGIAYLDGRLYLHWYNAGAIAVFDPVHDTLLGTMSTNVPLSLGGLAGDPATHTLLETDQDGNIYRVDPWTGQAIASYGGPGVFVGGLAVANGIIYAAPGLYQGVVYRYDAATAWPLGTMPLEITAGTFLGALGGDGIRDTATEYRIKLSSGEQRQGLDFGATANGGISGTKFNDLNLNGVQDAGEPGLAGWTIYADLDMDGQLDAGEPSAITGADGSYSLPGLAPGQYHIRALPQAGWITTTPAGRGRIYASWVAPSGDIITISELDPQTGAVINSFVAPGAAAGISPQGLAVGPHSLFYLQGQWDGPDTLYELDLDTGAVIDADVVDAESPGVFDGIAYLDGKLYLLMSSQGTILAFDPVQDVRMWTLSTGTSWGGLAGDPASGMLLVNGSNGEIYRVDPFSGQPGGLLANAGRVITGLAVVDGTVYAAPNYYQGAVYLYDAATGTSLGTKALDLPGGAFIGALGGDGIRSDADDVPVTLGIGELRGGVNFGAAVTGINGRKYEDRNHNGVQDAGEPGLAGWTIYLDTDGDGELDGDEPATITDANGNYSFVGLPLGNYIVEEVPQAGWTQTEPGPSGELWVVAPDLVSGGGSTTPLAQQLDPVTGAVLRQIPLPGQPSWFNAGLAFNGTSLFYLAGCGIAGDGVLYELDPATGAVRDRDNLGSISTLGMAAIGQRVYFLVSNGPIAVFDTATDSVVGTIDPLAASGGQVSIINGGLAALRGPGELVGFDWISQRFVRMDPDTGATLGWFGHGYRRSDGNNEPPNGIAVVDGNIYVNWSTNEHSFLDVYSRDGNLIRTTSYPDAIYRWGLGGDDVGRVVSVTPAAPVVTANFGGTPFGEIRGTKFHDRNGNGVRDAGEEGLAGWTIYIDSDGDGELDAGERSTVTDANGEYVFGNVVSGSYIIEEVQQPGWKKTSPQGGRLFASEIVDGMVPTGGGGPAIAELDPDTLEVIRTLRPPADGWWGDGLAFNGTHLFFLTDNNDTPTGNTLYEVDPETGTVVDSDVLPPDYNNGLAVIGNTVYVLRSQSQVVVFDTVSDTIVRTMDIAAINWSGGFSVGLTALRSPGRLLGYDYTTFQFVEVDAETGVEVARFDSGHPDRFPYGLASVGGRIYAAWYANSQYEIDIYRPDFTLEKTVFQQNYIWGLAGDDVARATVVAAGTTVTGVDFANVQLGEIRGTKFQDSNGDGVRQESEPALAGWTMYLDLDGDGVLDAGEPTRVTDANGQYAFIDLPLGDYLVEEVPQAGWVQTYPRGGDFWVVGSDQATAVARRMDPVTGTVLQEFALPGQASWWNGGLAFNGSHLFYAVGNGQPGDGVLYEIDPATGAVLDSDDVGLTATQGLAVLGQDVYILGRDNDIVVFNTVSDTVVRTLDIDAANAEEVWIGHGGLAAWRGPGELVTLDWASKQFVRLDPETGVVLGRFGQGRLDVSGNLLPPNGMAVVDGLFYVNWSIAPVGMEVYNRDGALVQTISLAGRPYFWGLGGDDVGRAIHLRADAGQAVADFGNAQLGEVRGTKYNDLNGNGVQDAGESGLPGWTVYLDADGDSELDADERWAISDDQGNYAIAGVMPGNYVLDEIPQALWRHTNRADGIYTLQYWDQPDMPGYEKAGILKLDPVTGDVLGWLPAPEEFGFTYFPEGLAYNGFDLFYAPGGGKTSLYKLDPETGAVRAQYTLPEGDYRGLAVIGNTVYAVGQIGTSTTIVAVNAATGAVERCAAVNGAYYGLAALRDPGALVTFDWVTGRIVELDPVTFARRSSFSFGFQSGDYLCDVGTANGNVYLNWHHNTGGTTDVFSRDGYEHWTLPMPANMYRNGLGGDDVRTPLRVESGQVITGASLGDQQVSTEVRGTAFDDANGNGSRDEGEGPLAGWTLYLDLNRNHRPDAGEPSAVTDGNGQYSFTGLELGDYVVEMQRPAGWRQTTRGERIFGVASDSANSIVELDPTTGAELRRFTPLWASPSGFMGMAYDGRTLYLVSTDGSQWAIQKLDPETGKPIDLMDYIALPEGQYDGLAVLGSKLYVQDSTKSDILVIDKATGTLLYTLDIDGLNPGAWISGGLCAVHGPDALMAIIRGGEALAEINPETGLVIRQMAIGQPEATGLAAAEGGVWVSFGNGRGMRFYSRDGVLLRYGSPLPYALWALAGDDNGRVVHVRGVLSGVDFGNVEDHDAGDTMATATPITVDGIWQDLAAGTIGDGPFGQRDVDLYRFTAGIHDRIALGRTGNVTLRLFDAEGNQIGDANRTFLALPYTGTYYLGVSGLANADYTPLVANSGYAEAAVEPYSVAGAKMGDVADTMAQAIELGAQAEAIGDGPSGDADVDLYYLWMNAGDTLNAETQFWMGNPMDTILRVFNASGVEVAFNDNPAPGNLYAQVSFTARAAGYYYVGVSGAGNSAYDPHIAGSGTAGSTGDYILQHTLTPDTTAPTVSSIRINDGAAQRSTVKKLAVTFSEPVNLAAGALGVKLSSGATIAATVTVTNPSGDQKAYVLTFSGTGIVGGSLADGIYDLIVSSAGVQDLAGNALRANYTQRFHRLFGDVDGNKVVNALDYAKLKATYGRSATDGLFNSAFDYEGNNVINALDLAQFRKRYGLIFSY